MNNRITLNENYSTTRLVSTEKPTPCHCALDTESNQDKFETVLFLPDGDDRKGKLV